MKSLIAVISLILALAGVAQADPPERAEKIRKEYSGSDAPDHLVFAAVLFSIKGWNATNPDIALRNVQDRMQLDSEDAAKAFLSRMLAAAAKLEAESGKVSNEMLCGPDAPRDKEEMYQRMDMVDDLRENKFHNVYVRFMSDLDERQQEAMTSWIQEGKEGFYYRTAEHKSLYEGTDYDVIGHVDMVCASRGEAR
ncbi:MAG: hypothetical protein ACREQ8_15210 [Woeseiaceae bacterium]